MSNVCRQSSHHEPQDEEAKHHCSSHFAGREVLQVAPDKSSGSDEVLAPFRYAENEPLRRLTVKDEATGYCLAIKTDRHLRRTDVEALLNQLIVQFGRPKGRDLQPTQAHCSKRLSEEEIGRSPASFGGTISQINRSDHSIERYKHAAGR